MSEFPNVFWSGLLSTKCYSVARTSQSQVWKLAKSHFRHLLLKSKEIYVDHNSHTNPLQSPMRRANPLQSPMCRAFHKISAGYAILYTILTANINFESILYCGCAVHGALCVYTRIAIIICPKMCGISAKIIN